MNNKGIIFAILVGLVVSYIYLHRNDIGFIVDTLTPVTEVGVDSTSTSDTTINLDYDLKTVGRDVHQTTSGTNSPNIVTSGDVYIWYE